MDRLKERIEYYTKDDSGSLCGLEIMMLLIDIEERIEKLEKYEEFVHSMSCNDEFYEMFPEELEDE